MFTGRSRRRAGDLLDQVDRSMCGEEVLPGGEVRHTAPDIGTESGGTVTLA
ncbi:MAG: hypothetical protein ACTHLP_07075 [Rhizobiaceae bacterium]